MVTRFSDNCYSTFRSNKKIGYSICYEYKNNKNELYYDESYLIKK